jgi:hypothetical protein
MLDLIEFVTGVNEGKMAQDAAIEKARTQPLSECVADLERWGGWDFVPQNPTCYISLVRVIVALAKGELPASSPSVGE